jgi:hypothetical protein
VTSCGIGGSGMGLIGGSMDESNDKNSISYFMREMTQQEFSSIIGNSEIKPHRLNIIKKNEIITWNDRDSIQVLICIDKDI